MKYRDFDKVWPQALEMVIFVMIIFFIAFLKEMYYTIICS